MATRSFILEIISAMAKGKVDKCPVCGKLKDLDSWVCQECFATEGNSIVLKVKDAVRQITNKVPDEVWRNLLNIARELLSADKPKGLEDRDLVKVLRPKLKDVPEGAIFAALATVRDEMAKEAARKADNEIRWQTALSAVRSQFPDGKKIQLRYFIDNPISFKGRFISDNMMKAACAHVINERVLVGKSQLAAAFVNARLERIDFPGIKRTETEAVPA